MLIVNRDGSVDEARHMERIGRLRQIGTALRQRLVEAAVILLVAYNRRLARSLQRSSEPTCAASHQPACGC